VRALRCVQGDWPIGRVAFEDGLAAPLSELRILATLSAPTRPGGVLPGPHCPVLPQPGSFDPAGPSHAAPQRAVCQGFRRPEGRHRAALGVDARASC
jgi:hypothetical protein